jgi:cupin 2 domain-containing protein
VIDNVFSDLPASLPEELTTVLLKGDQVRVERIVSTGHCSPPDFWYDQSEHEWVLVLQGAARLQFEDRVVELGSGDSINIPAHQKHRVDWTSPDEPTVWLAVFYR